MSDGRKWPGLAVLLCVALLCSVGCKESPPATSHPSPVMASSQDSGILGERTLQPLQERVFQMGGERDVANRYLSAVMVTTAFGDAKKSRCSGVLLTPRVVLTAGHCVCMPRQAAAPEGEGKLLIDKTSCAGTVAVKTVTYETPEAGVAADDMAASVEVFRGSVRPHPEMRIVLETRGSVVSSQADLAVVLLDEPVKEARKGANAAR